MQLLPIGGSWGSHGGNCIVCCLQGHDSVQAGGSVPLKYLNTPPDYIVSHPRSQRGQGRYMNFIYLHDTGSMILWNTRTLLPGYVMSHSSWHESTPTAYNVVARGKLWKCAPAHCVVSDYVSIWVAQPDRTDIH